MPTKIKAYSKEDWDTPDNPTFESVRTGCLMRMADSMETMCKDRIAMEAKIERLIKSVDYYAKECSRLERSRSSLRGQITKLKKKLAGEA